MNALLARRLQFAEARASQGAIDVPENRKVIRRSVCDIRRRPDRLAVPPIKLVARLAQLSEIAW